MRLLAIPATNSVEGINRQLLGYAERLVRELDPDVDFEWVDLNDVALPLFSPALDAAEGPPPAAHQLYAAIGRADAVLLSFAEYNGSYTPVWKNAFDWMSRIDQAVYQQKPVLMLAATPGPRAGAGVLGAATTTAPFFGADLIGSLGIGTFHASFGGLDAGIADPQIDAELRSLLERLVGGAGGRS